MINQRIAQTSIWAVEIAARFQGERSQKVLAILSIRPAIREEIQDMTGIEGNSLRPIIRKMLDSKVIRIQGLQINKRGVECEVLTLLDEPQIENYRGVTSGIISVSDSLAKTNEPGEGVPSLVLKKSHQEGFSSSSSSSSISK